VSSTAVVGASGRADRLVRRHVLAPAQQDERQRERGDARSEDVRPGIAPHVGGAPEDRLECEPAGRPDHRVEGENRRALLRGNRSRERGWIKTKNRQTPRFAEELAGAGRRKAPRPRVSVAGRLGD
jgi:hypothetical protein